MAAMTVSGEATQKNQTFRLFSQTWRLIANAAVDCLCARVCVFSFTSFAPPLSVTQQNAHFVCQQLTGITPDTCSSYPSNAIQFDQAFSVYCYMSARVLAEFPRPTAPPTYVRLPPRQSNIHNLTWKIQLLQRQRGEISFLTFASVFWIFF